MMPWYYGAGSEWVMALMMLLFWAGLIPVVVLVLRHLAARPGRQHDAQRMLAERLARGEIDQHEYTALREVLHTH